MRTTKLLAAFATVLLLAACASGEDPAPEPEVVSNESSATAPTSSGPAPGTQEDLVQMIGDRVFFGYDRFDLTPQARQTIEAWAGWLRQHPQVALVVEGHADERGTREYNLALGERRANSVKNYLVALGINGGRLTTISYGKERPAVAGSNESAWAQNRRSQVVVR